MKRTFVTSAIAAATAVFLAGVSTSALAQGKLSGDSVKIGVLTDMSGVYADYGGPGAVAAAKMAVQDFGGKMFGKADRSRFLDVLDRVLRAAAAG